MRRHELAGLGEIGGPGPDLTSADWFGQNGNGKALQLLLCTKPATCIPREKKGGHRPLDSGEVLSGYLS